MAPSPLNTDSGPISDSDSLPKFTNVNIREVNGVVNRPTTKKEDRGCIFFYDPPQIEIFHKISIEASGEEASADKKQSENMIRSQKIENTMNPIQRNDADALEKVVDMGDHFKVMVDVSEYSPREVSVKAVGDQELMIEAKREQGAPDSGNHQGHGFSHRYLMPTPVSLDAVSSSLAATGVLTVRAPKAQGGGDQRQREQESIQYGAPQKQESQVSEQHSRNSFDATRNPHSHFHDNRDVASDLETRMKQQMNFSQELPALIKRSPMAQGSMSQDKDCFKLSVNVPDGFSPDDISVKSVGEKEVHISGNSPAGASFSQKFTLSQAVKTAEIRSSLSREGVLTVTAPKIESQTQSPPPSLKNSSSHFSSDLAHNNDNHHHQQGVSPFRRPDPAFDDFFNRDPFHDHEEAFMKRKQSAFMENARNDFNSSLHSMDGWMEPSHRFRSTLNPMSPMTVANTKCEDDKVVTETETDFQVRVNVSGYQPNEISVKSIGTRELQITGEKAQGSSTSCFEKSFKLPGVANMEAVRSTYGQDGWLTISAPKVLN